MKRTTTAAVLVAVTVAVAVMLLQGGGTYAVHARFESAGRVVSGAPVEVAGREVGTVTGVSLTRDGQADLTVRIDDDALAPLHAGTRLRIRQVGSATLANNFVELTPGPRSAPALPDGAVLGTDHTTALVDLDAVLDTFNGPARHDIAGLIANSGLVFAGSGAQYFNSLLARLDPALTELAVVGSQLAVDHARLGGFITSAARASGAIASRRPDLRAAVTATARSMHAIAVRHLALEDVLVRAPAVLDQSRRTLAHLGTAADALRPSLAAVPAAAVPLAPFLHGMTGLMTHGPRVLARLNPELTQAARALRGFTALQPKATPALASTTAALNDSRHIVRGIRYYGSDLLVGILNGLVSIASGAYNKAGHYIHLEFAQSPQQFFGDGLGQFMESKPIIPKQFGIRTGLVSLCPGATAPPAPDGSSPYMPDPTICDPSENMSASVNQP